MFLETLGKIETYTNFKWWQKVIFYLGFIWFVFGNLFYWITYSAYKLINPQPFLECNVKLLYYWGWVDLIVIVSIGLVLLLIG